MQIGHIGGYFFMFHFFKIPKYIYIYIKKKSRKSFTLKIELVKPNNEHKFYYRVYDSDNDNANGRYRPPAHNIYIQKE